MPARIRRHYGKAYRPGANGLVQCLSRLRHLALQLSNGRQHTLPDTHGSQIALLQARIGTHGRLDRRFLPIRIDQLLGRPPDIDLIHRACLLHA